MHAKRGVYRGNRCQRRYSIGIAKESICDLVSLMARSRTRNDSATPIYSRDKCANIDMMQRNGRHSKSSDQSRTPYYCHRRQ